jgi:hypothetical protein
MYVNKQNCKMLAFSFLETRHFFVILHLSLLVILAETAYQSTKECLQNTKIKNTYKTSILDIVNLKLCASLVKFKE